MPLMFQPFAKYAEFSGRARRSEYWLWQLLWVALFALYAIVETAIMGGGKDANASAGIAVALVWMIAALAAFIPSLAVAVRRLHDADKPGAWLLIVLLPVIGAIVLLIFLLTDGTPGPNRYGEDPKGREPFTPASGRTVVSEVHHYHHGPAPAGEPAAPPAA